MTNQIENIPFPKQVTGRGSSRIPFCKWVAGLDVNHCIEWPFGLTPAGYGRVRYNGVRTSAHRVILEMAKGPPPTPEHHAAHAPVICHNPSCVNPSHLRWATPSENNMDRVLDGTVNGRGGLGISTSPQGRWRAYIYEGVAGQKKYKHLGVFNMFCEAVKVAAGARSQQREV